MSGGPYGRGKAPERSCLKIEFWPETDSRLWTKACAKGSLLDLDVGARADHAEISNRKAEKGYGRWLTFVTNTDPTSLTQGPGERITKGRVIAYVQHLREIGNASRTVLARRQELGEVAVVMDPTADWNFIKRLSSKVRATHKPARSKNNLKLSHELVDLGFELMASASDPTDYNHAITYRDGFMIAFLALDPLRRRNLAELEIGRSLVKLGSHWHVVFAQGETKTHAPYEVSLPDALVEPLEVYLALWRPVLAARTGRWTKPLGEALWVSKDGSPMTQMAIYDRIRARTKEKWGEAVNPHLFRDAAATTLAIADPANVRVAAPVLGHASFGTTQKCYNQAKGYEAQRTFHADLQALKEGEHAEA